MSKDQKIIRKWYVKYPTAAAFSMSTMIILSFLDIGPFYIGWFGCMMYYVFIMGIDFD